MLIQTQEEFDAELARMRKEELSKLPVMTLGQLLAALMEIPDYDDHEGKPYEQHVVFDFGDLTPTEFASWRGVYAEIALGYGSAHYTINGSESVPHVKKKEFMNAVRKAIGSTYMGWKGGDFTMTEDTPVWIDNPGNYTNTMLVAVAHDKYNVTLVTAKQSDV